MPEINIVDTKDIIRAIKKKYLVDFGCLSLTPLKYKLNTIINNYQLNNSDELIDRLYHKEFFYEEFVHELLNTQKELFRDPEFWIYMDKTLIHQLNGLFSNFNILIPACHNSFELISLLILLEENGLREKSNVVVSLISKYSSREIFENETVIKINDINFENINKIFPGLNMGKYFTQKSDSLVFNRTLLGNVFDIKQNLDFQFENEAYNLILARNRLLYFSLPHQNKIVENLVATLEKNGVIIFGHRENIASYLHKSDEIASINEKENIFKKKN